MRTKRNLLPLFLFFISSSTVSFHSLYSEEILPSKMDVGELILFDIKDKTLTYRINNKALSRFKNGRTFGVTPLKGPPYFSLNAFRVTKNLFDFDTIQWKSTFIDLNRKPLQQARGLALAKNVWQKVGLDNEEQRKEDESLIRSISQRIDGDLSDKCWAFPTKTRISSEFGSPRYLPDGQYYFHTGTDLRAGVGESVSAAQDGEVVFASPLIVTGNMVMLYHGGGVFSKYMHLSEIGVHKGDNVQKGQLIGKAGRTGRVTGPHLHWEIVWQGNPANPHRFLQAMAPICDPK